MITTNYKAACGFAIWNRVRGKMLAFYGFRRPKISFAQFDIGVLMPRITGTTRRNFLKTSSLAGGSLLLTGTRASGQAKGANDRIRIAVAGLNGRGQQPSWWLAERRKR